MAKPPLAELKAALNGLGFDPEMIIEPACHKLQLELGTAAKLEFSVGYDVMTKQETSEIFIRTISDVSAISRRNV